MTSRQCSLYHASSNELPIGKPVHARPVAKERDSAFEQLVDTLRPSGLPPRRKVFFLGDSPEHLFTLGAMSVRHIYQVRPLESAHKTDAMWLIQASLLWRAEGAGTPSRRVALYIRKSWDGAKSPWFNGWEYITPSMVVCRRLTEPERYAAVEANERANPGFQKERVFKRMMSNAFAHEKRRRMMMDEDIRAELGLERSYDVPRVRQYVPSAKKRK